MQNYLVFISANKINNFFRGTKEICSWKSEGILEQSIKNPPGSDNSFAPTLIDSHPLPVAKFGGNCIIKSMLLKK